jgi:hypothetical protein
MNADISSWNTSNGTDFDYTLHQADAFRGALADWDINQATNLTNFMNAATGTTTANYDALLIAWDAQGAMSFSGTVNFGGSKYTSGGAAEAARTSLISKSYQRPDSAQPSYTPLLLFYHYQSRYNKL